PTPRHAGAPPRRGDANGWDHALPRPCAFLPRPSTHSASPLPLRPPPFLQRGDPRLASIRRAIVPAIFPGIGPLRKTFVGRGNILHDPPRPRLVHLGGTSVRLGGKRSPLGLPPSSCAGVSVGMPAVPSPTRF